MTNAYIEFLEHITNRNLQVTHVNLYWRWGFDSFKESERVIQILGAWSPEMKALIREHLDVEYDRGFGRQYLGGTIWYSDGTWSKRGEYDGSEWWDYYERPLPPTCERVVRELDLYAEDLNIF